MASTAFKSGLSTKDIQKLENPRPRMSAVLQFAARSLLMGVHNLTHWTYKFQKVPEIDTFGAGFEPWTAPYLDAMFFFAGLGAVCLAISLLAFCVSWCVCCCCCRPARGGGRACLTGTVVVVLAVLLLATAGALVFVDMSTKKAFDASIRDANTGMAIFTNATTTLADAVVAGNAGATAVSDFQSQTSGDPTAPSNALAELSKGLADFNKQAKSLMGSIPSLASVQKNINVVQQDGDTYVFWGLYGVAGLFGLTAVLLLVGVCCRSACLVYLACVVGVVSFLLGWILSGAFFAAAVAGADACVAPTAVILARASPPTEVITYLTCTNAAVNPFSSYFLDLDAALVKAHQAVVNIQSYCTSTSNGAVVSDCATIKRVVAQLTSVTAYFEAELACTVPHNLYVSALDNVCNGLVYWLVFELSLSSFAALFTTMVTIMALFLGRRLRAASRRYDVGRRSMRDGDDEEREPLFSNIKTTASAKEPVQWPDSQRTASRPGVYVVA